MYTHHSEISPPKGRPGRKKGNKWKKNRKRKKPAVFSEDFPVFEKDITTKLGVSVLWIPC